MIAVAVTALGRYIIMEKITILADRIKINGPRVDNSYTVTFEVGEYEREKVAKLLLLTNTNKTIKLTVEDNGTG